MRKGKASLFIIATFLFTIATMMAITDSSNVAETVPPSPNFIKVSSTMLPGLHVDIEANS